MAAPRALAGIASPSIARSSGMPWMAWPGSYRIAGHP